MSDKDNENLAATTAENVDAKETVSEEPSTEDTSVEASDPLRFRLKSQQLKRLLLRKTKRQKLLQRRHLPLM